MRRKVTRALRFLAGALLAVAALIASLLFVLLRVVDDETYRDAFVAAFEKATGRHLEIGGGLVIDRSLRPTLTVREVSLSNATWGSQPHLLRAEEMRVGVELLPLLGGELWLEIRLRAPDVVLELNAAGEPNWALGQVAATPATGSKPQAALPAVHIGSVDIADGHVSYRDAASGAAFETTIDHLLLSQDRDNGRLAVDLDGTFRGIDVAIDGRLDALQAGRRFAGVLVLDAPGVAVRASGSFEPADRGRVDVDVDAAADSLQSVARVLQVGLPDLGRVEARGRLSGERGAYRVDDVAVTVNARDIQAGARGGIERLARQPTLALELTVDAERLSALSRLSGLAPFLAELPELGPAAAAATLRSAAGVYSLENLAVELSDDEVEVDLSGSLRDMPASPRVDLLVSSRIGNLARVPAWLSLGDLVLPPLGPVRAGARVSGVGRGVGLSDIDVALGGDDLHIAAAGAIADVLREPRVELQLSARAATLAHLSPYVDRLAVPLPAIGPVQAGARLTGRGDELDLLDLDIELGSQRLAGRVAGAVRSIAHRPRIDVAVDVSAQSLAELSVVLPDVPFADVGPVTGRGRLLGEGMRLNLEGAKATLEHDGLNVAVAGDVTGLLDRRGLQLEVSVSADGLERLQALSDAIPRLPDLGMLRGSAFVVGDAGGYAVENLQVDLAAPQMRLELAGTIRPPFAQPVFDVTADLQAATLAELNRIAEWVPAAVTPLGPFTARARIAGTTVRYALHDIDARVTQPGVELALAGSLEGMPGDASARLVMQMSAQRLTSLSALLPFAPPDLGPVDGEASLQAAAGRYVLDALRLKLGASDVAGDVAIDLTGKRPAISAKLVSEVIDGGELFAAKASPQEPSQRKPLFSARPLELAWMQALDASMDFHGGRIALGDHTYRDVALKFDLHDAVLAMDSVRMQRGRGSITAGARLDGSRAPPSASLIVEIDDIDGEMLHGLPAGAIEGGNTSGSLFLSTQGSSIEAMMANLNGAGLFEMGEIKILDSALKIVSSDVLTGVLHTLNPFSTRDGSKQTPGYTTYDCAVIGFDINDGVVSSDRDIAFQSERFNVGGSGTINLRTEAIDIDVKPRARKGLGLSIASMTGGFKVKGTLSEPQLGGSLKGLVEAGAIGAVGGAAATSAATSAAVAGSALAAPATAGLSVAPVLAIGVHGRLTAAQFSCERTLQRIAEQRSQGLRTTSRSARSGSEHLR